MTTKISYTVACILGSAMIFLGIRFFLSPESATAGFGLHLNAQGDYSFHYIKGIRDVFSGLLIFVLVMLKERRALGVTLLLGTMIPVNDMLIVLGKSYNGLLVAIPHIIASVICAVFGTILLATKHQRKEL